MTLSQKIVRIAIRSLIVVTIYFSVQLVRYSTFTIKRGVVADVGYFLARGKDHISYSYYPIVAFAGPLKTDTELGRKNTSTAVNKYGIFPDTGNIYLTQLPVQWHFDERCRIGDSLDYYFKEDDPTYAGVLTFKSYWLSLRATCWMVLAIIIWTMIVDIRRIRKEEKQQSL